MVKHNPINVKSTLTLTEYQAKTHAANQFNGLASAIDQLRFGLFGEIGGLLAGVKKSHRDFGRVEQVLVQEELGDAFWYLTEVIGEYGLTLQDVGESALHELQRRFGIERSSPPGALNFLTFDGLLDYSDNQLKEFDRIKQLSELASNAGRLLGNVGTDDLATHAPLTLLAAVMADMVTVAGLFQLRIIEIIEANLAKTKSRWPDADPKYLEPFDKDSPAIEQLPRQFSMHFIERHTPDSKPYVIQQLRGVNIGDRLTDNRTEHDGYRFHDVFHLAYVAHLGWSPVIRGLLKLKRKSDKDLDENQDGARAMIIEEGIATWIFNHAGRDKYFEGKVPGKLEYGLLKQVRDMVDGYEVSLCPLWQWELAVLDGFSVFRQLRDSEHGGIVHVDMLKHTIAFEPLAAEPDAHPAPRSKPVRIGAALLPPKEETT